MLNKLTSLFQPRIEPEQRIYRIQLARTLNIGLLVFLGIWFISTVVEILSSDIIAFNRVLDLIILLCAAMLVIFSQFHLLQRDVLRSGLVISILVTGLVSFLAFRFPQEIQILSPLYLVPVICTGVFIGGVGVYLTAGISLLLVTLAWFNASAQFPDQLIYNTLPGLRFLVVQAVLLFGIAGLIESLMISIQTTVRLLHSRTQQLSSLAHTDPLTQLANRRFLIEMLEREFSRARRYHRPLSLVYLDLDGFKKINDTHGHMFGDELLQGAATSMKAILRTTDMLARIGGDEFAILLPETMLKEAVLVTEKLRKALSAYGHQIKRPIAPLSFCSGVSALKPGDESIDDLLSRADAAQYLAKTTGKAHTRTENELPAKKPANS